MRTGFDLVCETPRMLRARRLRDAGLVTGAFVLAVLACSKNPTRPIARTDSPLAVVQRFRAAWVERDTLAFRSCLAQVFNYGNACADTAGNLFFELGPDRDSCLIAAARLFRLGSASQPPATSISVQIDSIEVLAVPEDTLHERDVFGTTSVVIRTPLNIFRLGGFTGFRVVRGDAFLAADPPDSTRWFIKSWIEVVMEDTPPSAAASLNARQLQLMMLRLDTRNLAPPPVHVTDSAVCDSLLRSTWGSVLRRYLH